MSSDPIEVLRDMKVTMMLNDYERSALDAAIASLSAPKPESAEAVFNCPTCPVSVRSRWQEPECPECGERCYLDPTAVPAPPRPEASDEDCPKCRRRGDDCGEHWPPDSTAPQQASAPVGVEGWRVEPVEDDPDMLAVETPDGRTWFAKRGDRVFELAEALALAQQPAAEVYVDFPQVGTAGPLAVVDGKVTLPDTTMNDLIRHARTGYVEQPVAVDEATRRDAERYRYLRRPEAWKENHISERGASAIFIGDGWRGEAKDGEALDAAIDRILAGQQQGGEP